jgi:hypothetical protein
MATDLFGLNLRNIPPERFKVRLTKRLGANGPSFRVRKPSATSATPRAARNLGVAAREVRGRLRHTPLLQLRFTCAAPAYDRPLYAQKCSALFEHIYESYPERDAGVYATAG